MKARSLGTASTSVMLELASDRGFQPVDGEGRGSAEGCGGIEPAVRKTGSGVGKLPPRDHAIIRRPARR